ncbi:Protein FAR1-RELATED SEQUENCE 6 [Artemisia annua]|uniref:Protein FAR1-RELATED SEQUENCE n=1 Tax=Artemisia annua TaxID=35608 RepID=A0A2U1LF18_ARTAN|nr:Protein FAR1-RELATED SEQUENCE 6 [Artemisia annua]
MSINESSSGRGIPRSSSSSLPLVHHEKVPQKLGRYGEYKVIKKTLKTLVYESVEHLDFEEGWSKMIKDYCLEENKWLCSLFNDRKRWMPVYVKEISWAAMSTTQRSESMNAFFDGYVNSKTSLRQFVEQYDNALKSKMEKENKANFDSLNSSYKLLTQFFIERQFHESYTNAIFKLFQDELKGMLCCNFSTFKTDDMLSTFHVTDIFQGKQDVKEIPSRYILTRWRKDVKHRHYYATNCYDEFKSGEQVKQSDQLCGNFYEASHIANSHEKYQYVMECINVVKEQLTDDSNWGEHHVTESTKKLLLPLKVRGKGRPPEHEGKEILTKEKIVKKKQQRKKKSVNPTLVDMANTKSSHATISPDGDSLICNYNFDLNQLKSTMVEACGVNWVQKMSLIKLLLCFCQSLSHFQTKYLAVSSFEGLILVESDVCLWLL